MWQKFRGMGHRYEDTRQMCKGICTEVRECIAGREDTQQIYE